MIDFTEVEAGIFEGAAQRRGRLHPAESRRRPLAGQVDGPDDRRLGDGARQRQRRSAGSTLTNTDAGKDNFQVFLKPKCDPAVAAFAPKQWRLERGQMMLMSEKGETWRSRPTTTRNGGGCPIAPIPLIMLRQ